jgi:hypothetical protein
MVGTALAAEVRFLLVKRVRSLPRLAYTSHHWERGRWGENFFGLCKARCAGRLVASEKVSGASSDLACG